MGKIINRNDKKISLSDDLMAVIIDRSEGNPGAVTAICSLLNDIDGMIALFNIADLGLRGQYIYMLWNDACGRDLTKFKDALTMMKNEIISDAVSEANLSRTRALPLFDDSIQRPEDHSQINDYYKKQVDKFLEKYASTLGLPTNGG